MTVSGRHRLICLACTIVIWCIQASAQGYFLDRTDVTLDYVRTDADNGKFIWRHTVHVSDIKDCGSYIRYVTESAFSKENGKPLYRSSVFETTDVDSTTV